MLALGQVLLIVVVGLVGLAVTGRGELLAGISRAVAWYVAFFVLGFVALAALWSVAGALASRQEDLQSTTLPGQMILLIPYFISAFASDKVQTIVSMLPIVSTMVMPGRMAQGDVPWWQVAVAIAVTVAGSVRVRPGRQPALRADAAAHGWPDQVPRGLPALRLIHHRRGRPVTPRRRGRRPGAPAG